MKYQHNILKTESATSHNPSAPVEGSELLPYTWERLIPAQTINDSAGRKFLDIHFQHYEAAAQYVKGKKVLDIACGVGYGSQMLRLAGASTVVGVDVSPEAVQYAREHYQTPGVEFVCANAEEFEWSEQFDVIVSFETIEHLHYPGKFIERIHRLLVSEGTFLLSVPLGETRHFDPYHLHIFNQKEVFELLQERGFLIDWHHCEECFLTRGELLRWGQQYPTSHCSPSLRELWLTPRGWRILYDFVFRGGFHIPDLLVVMRSR